jgi:hypothetical protein
VVEISRYAAGPLAGIGACEPREPKYQDRIAWRRGLPSAGCRAYGAVSGYFANYNAGKSSIVLDCAGRCTRRACGR